MELSIFTHTSFSSSWRLPSFIPKLGFFSYQFDKKHRPYGLKCYCDASKDTSTYKTAIQRISEKLRSQGYIEEEEYSDFALGPGSPGEIFLPSSKDLLKKNVGHTLEMDTVWKGPQNLGGQVKKDNKGREVLPTLAELTLPEEERKRLITLGIRSESKLRIGKAGVSEGIIHSIHQRWINSEVVKIKCDDLSRTNMRRTHHLLEMKTGGMVVWRAGSVIIIYRGTNYESPYVKAGKSLGITVKPMDNMKYAVDIGSLNMATGRGDATVVVDASNKETDMFNGNRPNSSFGNCQIAFHENESVPLPGKTEHEMEIDSLLDGLGPRFSDWWGYDPSPVDADLLPAFVSGYIKPVRLLPCGMKPKLTDDEMTRLRRLARPLSPHFALGINQDLQGLAFAMVKLWERSEIAKIVVKHGVENTDSEEMAEELKQLTGGSLLSRDREFIVFYRGKDFLPSSVSAVLEERKAMTKGIQEKEEIVESEAVSPILSEGEMPPSDSDRVSEFAEARELWIRSEEQRKIKEEESRAKKIAAARRVDSKLKIALGKKTDVEGLADTELNPVEPSYNEEMLTEEERFMLRKLGLRMKPFLLLGRRGVFGGVVENMHLHWKYRELVKIISKEKSVAQANDTARILESESGGILVAVERVSKGFAIIVYRGKNYRRPTVLRPKSLLTKNAALKHSKDIQRQKSLNHHMLQLERNMQQLESQLSNVENKQTSELLIDQLDPTYLSEDEGEIALQLTEKLHYSCPSKEKEEITLHSNKETDSANPEDAKSEDGVTYFDHFDGNNEKEDSLSKSHTEKNAAKSGNIKTDPADHKNLKNNMAEKPLRIEPLSNKQRLTLRRQALQLKKPAQFHIGKSNVLSGLAKSIRSYFEKHALVIVGVKGRAKGTSIQEIVFQLEEATGGVFVSQEPTKIILYRGWPECEDKPSSEIKRDELEDMSPELIKAISKECGLNVEDLNNNIFNVVKQTACADNRFLNMNMTDENHDVTLYT